LKVIELRRRLTKVEVELVFHKIAGEVQCEICHKWYFPEEVHWGMCQKCIPKILIPQKMFDTITEAALTLKRKELFA